MSKHSFPLNERLKSRKTIENLFEKSNTEFKWPVLLMWNISDEQHSPTLQAGFTVSRRNFRKAVHRNLLKRRMREAYRLQKNDLIEHLTNKQLSMNIMFVYQAKEINDFDIIQSAIGKLLSLLKKNPAFSGIEYK